MKMSWHFAGRRESWLISKYTDVFISFPPSQHHMLRFVLNDIMRFIHYSQFFLPSPLCWFCSMWDHSISSAALPSFKLFFNWCRCPILMVTPQNTTVAWGGKKDKLSEAENQDDILNTGCNWYVWFPQQRAVFIHNFTSLLTAAV